MAKPSQTITLAEAAERLGVHYMTAYRYVRTGRLHAEKVGQEWRVQADDLAAFQAGAATPARRGRPADHAARLLDRLLANDEAGAWSVVEGALAGGMDPEQIHLELLTPTLVTIGDRWASGELSVAQEHQASAIVLRLIGRLGPQFRRRGRPRGTVLIAAPPGDRHGIPTAMAADLIRARGFVAVDLGADVPIESLVETAASADRLVAVSLCASTGDNDEAIAAAIAALRDRVDVPVLLGGGAVRDADHARALGADLHSASFDDVVAALEQLSAA